MNGLNDKKYKKYNNPSNYRYMTYHKRFNPNDWLGGVKKRKNITMKKPRKMHNPEQEIIYMFLQMLNTIKLYHWKTRSYATHKATDELYSELNSNIDNFVETMLGKKGNRVDLSKVHSLPLNDFNSIHDFKNEIEKYKLFMIKLVKIEKISLTNNSDLLNIRDEILGNLDKFTYLLTFT